MDNLAYYELKDQIEDLTELVRQGTDITLQQAKEIEVLTQERDNALLRIEELERSFGLGDPYPEHRGGVHPNA